MKRLSIKARVTLWYMSFILLIVTALLVFVMSASDWLLRSSSQSQLKETVEKSLTEIGYDDGQLEIDDDLSFSQNGIYLAVYAENGEMITGLTPPGYQEQVQNDIGKDFFQNEVRTVGSDEQKWYKYDVSLMIPSYGTIWVSGLAAVSESGTITNTFLMLFLIGLPFIVIIAAIGGYYITKRALAPIARITKAVEEISEGNDLSRRIRLGEGKDEVYKLANTFDQMFARLETSFEKEKQFTSDASHELRTPVSVIIAQCEYALENAETLAEAREAIEVIFGQSQKVSGLISQLLNFTRMDKGTHKLDKELINISELAEIVAEEQQIAAAEKHIDIRQRIEQDIYIEADQTMLMRLMMNLLSNAVAYGQEKGYILFTLKREGDFVRGSIEDNGIGIAGENLEKIWDRFYQVDAARTAGQSYGAGLGLAMVKWIAEAHGGSVFVKSTLGKGSVFGFKIPIKK